MQLHCMKQYYIKIESGDENLTLSSATVITLAEPHCIGETLFYGCIL